MERDEVVLVYLLKEVVESSEEIPIKFGGQPVWMYNHKFEKFQCSLCKNVMTFLCQVFAPLNTEHTYNRAFYIFFCEGEKCQNNKKGLQVFRMQSSELDDLVPYHDEKKEGRYKILKKEYYVETDIIDSGELKVIADKVIKELNEIDEEDDDSDIEDEKISNAKMKYLNEEEDLEGIEELTETKKQDPVFEVYRGTISKLNYPVILYAKKPLEFKDQHINVSQKKCSTCKGPSKFQFQINSCLLSNFQELTSYDWGTIRIYTCQNSCKGEKGSVFREDVELQIEEDTALNKEQIEKQLAQIEKQNKKKEMKREKRKLKKMEKKEREEEEGKKEVEERIKQKEEVKQEKIVEDNEEDWESAGEEEEEGKEQKN